STSVAPNAGGRSAHEHVTRGGADPTVALDLAADRRRSASHLDAKPDPGIERDIRGRVLAPHFRPVARELLGDQHRQAGPPACRISECASNTVNVSSGAIRRNALGATIGAAADFARTAPRATAGRRSSQSGRSRLAGTPAA